ncbi:condensation domain-containing protein [Gordonia bronchialis]|uniref:condensation domain-containing protein n=1 Tax=Gordonia bronchialis TaxID=2054 RepID=UPI001D1471D8|nr:condensation domain-containing protein [Gordonia bronchialis]MCC3324457.1 condensation domain-containing protein [Gordonia bronchialis]
MSHRTTAELAAAIGAPGAARTVVADITSGPVPALPIVRWLEELVDGDADRIRGFHQSALLRVPADFDPNLAARAIGVLLRRHHMLRARLVADERPWRFDVGATAPDPVVARSTDRDVKAVARQAREALNPVAGQMISATWIDFGDDPGRLLLQIHHLVVDGVSWRSLVPELLAVYTQLADGVDEPSLGLPPAPTPYAAWAHTVAGLDRTTELPYWTGDLVDAAATAGALFRRRIDPAVDTEDTARRHVVEVDTEVSGRLLGPTPSALGVAVDDVLLGAFGAAAGRPTLVDLEGHGRVDDLLPGADGGLGYGVLRYLSGTAAAGISAAAGIEFNYLGRYRSFEFGDWGMAPESADIGAGGTMPAGHGLVVDITTVDGPDGTRMRASWTYQPGVIDDESVRALAERWLAALREVARPDEQRGAHR